MICVIDGGCALRVCVVRDDFDSHMDVKDQSAVLTPFEICRLKGSKVEALKRL